MTIKLKIQAGLNATFWGINPCFSKLAHALKQRGVKVEKHTTKINGSNCTSIGTPSIVIFKGVKVNGSVKETDMRDLMVLHEPRKNRSKTRVELPERFIRASQVSKYAASFLRANGYTVGVDIVDLDEVRGIDFDLDSGIRFDLVDPSEVEPAILRRELGLNW